MRLDELPPLDGVPDAVRRALRALDTEAGARRLRAVIAGLVLLALVVVVGRGGSRPRDPYLASQPAPTTTRQPATARSLPGFGEARVIVSTTDGSRTLCVAVADTEAQRQQGLMGRHDLGGYDAMVFRFPSDSSVRFFMRDTPLPLSIAWYDSAGAFVSSTDMDPCPTRDGCPTYGAAGPYRVAFEVPKGALAGAGLGSGSRVSVGGTCT